MRDGAGQEERNFVIKDRNESISTVLRKIGVDEKNENAQYKGYEFFFLPKETIAFCLHIPHPKALYRHNIS